jgi:polyisoprenoid-binding protein YceI
MKLASFIFAASILGFNLSASAAEFSVDNAHSNIRFEIDHLMISTVEGKFGKFDGKVIVDDKTKDLTMINGTVDVASIDTDQKKRDEHLKSAEFFDAKKFPKMTLAMTDIKVAPGKEKKVDATLKIRDVTKTVRFTVANRGVMKDPMGNEKFGLRASAEINRKDFGLTYNKALETGGVLIGETVKISINLETLKNERPATADTGKTTKSENEKTKTTTEPAKTTKTN